MTRADDIRKEILFQAYALRPIPVTATRVQRECKKQQMDFTLSEISRELPFLVSDGLLISLQMLGVTEDHYNITSAGVRHYERNFAA